MKMRRSIVAAAGFAAMLLGAGFGHPALAQAPAPFGFWMTQSGETLLITQQGECSQGLNGSITVAGRCTWNSSSRGGILTIYGNGPVYYNVVWVNQTTITVWGDVFTLRQ